MARENPVPTRIAACLLAATFLAPPETPAADWPQWRGTHRDGRSPETGLLQEWPETGPQLLWQADGFGAGYSSVAVAGDRVFTLGDIGDGQYLFAASSGDGRMLWRRRVGPAWSEPMFGGSRSTPTVDGKRVYALGTDGDLLCADAETGEPVWRRHLVNDFLGKMMFAGDRYDWRFSESPLVDGERLVVTPGARKAAMIALDKNSGELIWRASIPALGDRGLDGAGYASAVVSEAGGIRQYVQLLGRGLVGVAAENGHFLWGYNRIANHVANVPTPLVAGDYVFASSGYGAGAVLLELKRSGKGIALREVYFLESNTMQNHHGGLVLHDGHVFSGTGLNKGFPLCVDLATGSVKWGPIRNRGRGSAAPIYADGRLYLRYQSGLMLLVEATPDGYRERGSFTIPGVEKESWSHPAIADGRLFLREQDRLLVYDIRLPPDKPEP